MRKAAAEETNKWAIGVDIGGTKINVAHVDLSGKVHKKIQFAAEVEKGAVHIIHETVQAAKKLIQAAQFSPEGIGIGMAGQIDPDNGTVFFAPNLDWHHIPLKHDVEAALGIPTKVIGDVKAITLAEWRLGAGKDCSNLVCMFVGTGIGGGIVSDGRLLTGSSNTAGEIGHMIIDMHGRKCTCGNQGCLETIAGGWGIAKRAQEAVTRDPAAGKQLLQAANGQISAISAKTVALAAENKDPLAQQLAQDTVAALIVGASNIVNVLNPQRLIIGGGVIEGFPWFVKAIDEGVRKRALKAACRYLEVVPSILGVDNGAIGAALSILHEL